MHKRATTAIMVTATGIAVAGGLTLAAASDGGSGETGPVNGIGSVSRQLATATPKPPASEESGSRSKKKASADAAKEKAPKKAKKKAKKKGLPRGVSTATSFWDPETASGKPMSYKTLASPYWPLGTKVKITYGGKSATGVVQDFGPAEWAVAQHSPPAIIDLSEKMMADLTGTRSNVVPVKFQVLDMGTGRSYVRSGTGYDLAMGRQSSDK